MLATDLDREGEAIAWHTLQVLKGARVLPRESLLPVVRVTFNEITESAIKSALRNPGPIREPLVRAYFARVGVDHLLGFHLSPVLWRKLPGCRSAGRVQSAVLRMVCEREASVQAFQPIEFWSLTAVLAPQGAPPAATAPAPSTGLLSGQGTNGLGTSGYVHNDQGAGVAGEGAKAKKVRKKKATSEKEGEEAGEALDPGMVRAELTHWRGMRVGKGGEEGKGQGRLTQEMAEEAVQFLNSFRRDGHNQGSSQEEGQGRTQGSRGKGQGKGKRRGKGEGEGRGEGLEGELGGAAARECEGSGQEKGLIVMGTRQWVSQRSPPPPFSTSSLQQEASLKLKLSPATTMQVSSPQHEERHPCDSAGQWPRVACPQLLLG